MRVALLLVTAWLSTAGTLAAQTHWAFEPVSEPAVPTCDTDWAATPIDHFVWARLQERGLRPSGPADRRTLIRRATFDLTGLPPTFEEVEAFVADDAPDAYGRLIDRLLTSPRYGERWGRHWLDVARYADTKGYVFQEERRFPFSYTYRDWVIRALNEDLPYDQFLMQQIAADRLDLGNDPSSLAALGFLTLGRRFLNNRHDIIDDRIDVVTRGTMALTVSCARCHDHKYDPIPTEDYYSLYGVFASSREPADLPQIGECADPQAASAYAAELEKRSTAVKARRDEIRAECGRRLRDKKTVADAILQAVEWRRSGKKPDAKPGVGRVALERWRKVLDRTAKTPHPFFAALHAFVKSGELHDAHPAMARRFGASEPASLREVVDGYGAALSELLAAEKAAEKDAEQTEEQTAELQELRRMLLQQGGPADASGDLNRLMDRDQRNRLRALEKQVAGLKVTHPGAPPHAMALEDDPKPADAAVFLRGNSKRRGPVVPRRFLAALAGDDRPAFRDGSGRLELARAITNPSNPLTARVLVNRVWMHHLGQGLVTTPSDFGVRGAAPSHAKLLDWLATKFVQDGWSLKRLHRRIMLSSTYRQAARRDDRASEVDPDNRLLWKASRRRLDFEQLRDSMLAVSGRLDPAMGGRAVPLVSNRFGKSQQIAETIRRTAGDPSWNVYSTRRSVYLFIDRQNLAGTFRAFDFANPDAHCARRHQTTVPQRALFLLNSPFIAEQARALAALAEHGPSADVRIGMLYRRVFGRQPSQAELEAGRAFVAAESKAVPSRPSAPHIAWSYGYGAIRDGRVDGFTPLPHFTGSVWQGGPKLPDPTLGWVSLSAQGGHPGSPGRDAIRRWTAQGDGVIRIAGVVRHASEKGNGVLARIVSSRSGVLAEATVLHGQEELRVVAVEVRVGDTIDFVISCGKDEAFDSFSWAPTIGLSASTWTASQDFRGPVGPAHEPLSPWARYAQVLLMTNEFAFVD